jgi:hypothetical protein
VRTITPAAAAGCFGEPGKQRPELWIMFKCWIEISLQQCQSLVIPEQFEQPQGRSPDLSIFVINTTAAIQPQVKNISEVSRRVAGQT